MNEELLTVKEVSQILKCNINYAYELVNKGFLPYTLMPRKRIRRSSVNEFILKNENKDLSNLDNIKDIEVKS